MIVTVVVCGFDEGAQFADAAPRQGRQTGGDGAGVAAPAGAAGSQRPDGQDGDESPLQGPKGNTIISTMNKVIIRQTFAAGCAL